MVDSANLTYYERSREVILAKSGEYYRNDRDKIKQRRNNLSEEQKNKTKEYQKMWGESWSND